MRPSVRHRNASAAASLASTQDLPSFERDIRPMFAPFASAMMWRFDLTNYDAVLANASTIQGRLQSTDNAMPPPPFPPFTSEQIALFNSWIQNGCLP